MAESFDPRNAPALKAVAPSYHPPPFYFVQPYDDGNRVVAWSGNPEQVRRLFFGVLALFPEVVDVLLKVEAPDGDREKDWIRYHAAGILQQRIEQTAQLHQAFVFTDGSHQFCVRDDHSGEYFAFDEHGIFFLYFDLSRVEPLLKLHGFEPRYEEPLFGSDHYHYYPPNAPERLRAFVRDLGLELVPAQEE